MKKSSTRLMSEGSISKNIIYFALPILLGNLFQQLYNVADSIIVGNYLGSNALAAVSSSGNLIYLLVGFFQGLAVGGGIVVAKFFGSKDQKKVHQAIHAFVAFGLILSIIISFLGFYFAPQILKLMNTPPNVIQDSTTYFQVYFAGAIGLIMYNVFVGILQAVGDSRNPLYFLMVATILNVLLDLLFIGVLGFGVEGAALATVIAQLVSALLCLYKLTHTTEIFKLEITKLSLNPLMIKRIIHSGLPAGMQNSIIALANVVVQSHINSFGEFAMAGCGAYSKIEGFAFLPITSFTMAMTTFVSQNMGAKKYDRVKKGANFGILCCIISSQLIGFLIYIFAPYVIAIFDQNPTVIMYGTQRVQVVVWFFAFMAFTHAMSGVLRGAGKSIIPLIVTVVSWCVLRVTILTVFMPIFKSIWLVHWVYPITWIVSAIILVIYYYKSNWLPTSNHNTSEA